MILYHGSSVEVLQPNLKYSRPRGDFGLGTASAMKNQTCKFVLELKQFLTNTCITMGVKEYECKSNSITKKIYQGD